MNQGAPRLTPQGVVWEGAEEPAEQIKPKPPAIRRDFGYRIEDGKGEVIAHIKMRPRDGVYGLDDLWVHPDHRRKGYASALLQEALNEWRRNETIYLSVEPYTDQPLDNATLTTFYGRFGFAATDVPGVLCRRANPAVMYQWEEGA